VLADSILETAERNWSVIPAWLEYLRHRALAMLVPTAHKALIARLASHLMGVAYMDPKKLRPFLDGARDVVASYANETFHIADYVAVHGPAAAHLRGTLPTVEKKFAPARPRGSPAPRWGGDAR
jgi:hypothetical protein